MINWHQCNFFNKCYSWTSFTVLTVPPLTVLMRGKLITISSSEVKLFTSLFDPFSMHNDDFASYDHYQGNSKLHTLSHSALVLIREHNSILYILKIVSILLTFTK